MRQTFTIFSHRNPPFGEFDKLPVVKRWNYGRRAWKIIATGLSITAGSIVLLLSRPFASLELFYVLPLFALLFGLIIAVAGVSYLFMRGEIRIDQQSVAVNQVHLWKHYHWVAPLGEFRGVALRVEKHSGEEWVLGEERSIRTTYKLYSVVMVHPDPSKNICLYTSRSSSRARELKELASRVLHLPALGNP